MRKQLLPRMPVPATGKRERDCGVEVGWGSESGRCRVLGRRFDGCRGRDLDGDRRCFGDCEGWKEDADSEDILEQLEQRVRVACGTYLS